MRILAAAVCLALLMASASVCAQQKPSAYPAKGQSDEKKAQDDGSCQAWAKKETGIDPMAVASAPPPTTSPQGERVRGAVGGAAAGYIVGGATGGSKSSGATVGATAGVIAGGSKARRNQSAQAQQAQAAQAQALDTYWRAYGACMSSRGYTVK